MTHSWIVAYLLLTTLIWRTSSITNRIERRIPARNIRRHIGNSAHNDWEIGLREATYQTLLREHFTDVHLREHILSASLIGRQDTAIPFGDIIVVARGQLFSTHDGYKFVQDAYQNDCDECHNKRNRCGKHQCDVWKSPGHEQLVALWTVKKIRHRDPHYGYRYETEYTISPVNTAINNEYITRSGRFDYNIPGHVFVIKSSSGFILTPNNDIGDNVYKNQATEHYSTVSHNDPKYGHHRNGNRPGILTGHKHHHYPNYYTPYDHTTTKYSDTSNIYKQSTTDPKEIELYKQLIESLASKTSTSNGPHRFSLNHVASIPEVPIKQVVPIISPYPTKATYQPETTFIPSTLIQLPSGQLIPFTEITSSTHHQPDMSTIYTTNYQQPTQGTVPEKITPSLVHFTTQFVSSPPDITYSQPDTFIATKPTLHATYFTPQTTETEKTQTTVHYFTPVQTEQSKRPTSKKVPTPTTKFTYYTPSQTEQSETPSRIKEQKPTTKFTYFTPSQTEQSETPSSTNEQKPPPKFTYFTPAQTEQSEMPSSTKEHKPTTKFTYFTPAQTEESDKLYSKNEHKTSTKLTTKKYYTSPMTTENIISTFESTMKHQPTLSKQTTQVDYEDFQSSLFPEIPKTTKILTTQTVQQSTRENVPTTTVPTTIEDDKYYNLFPETYPTEPLQPVTQTPVKKTLPTEPLRPVTQVPLKKPYPDSINDQLPPPEKDTDTTIPYVSSTVTQKVVTQPEDTVESENKTHQSTVNNTEEYYTTNTDKTTNKIEMTTVTTKTLAPTTTYQESSTTQTTTRYYLPPNEEVTLKTDSSEFTKTDSTTIQYSKETNSTLPVTEYTTINPTESSHYSENLHYTTEDIDNTVSNALFDISNYTTSTMNFITEENPSYIISHINSDGTTAYVKTTSIPITTLTYLGTTSQQPTSQTIRSTKLTYTTKKKPITTEASDFLLDKEHESVHYVNNQNSNINDDDIFGNFPETSKPTKSTTTNFIQSDISKDLFGNERQSKRLKSQKSYDSIQTTTYKQPKIIYSNFFEASTMAPTTPMSTIYEDYGGTSLAAEPTRNYEVTKEVYPLTSQSFSTSISFEVNKRNQSNLLIPVGTESIQYEPTIKANLKESHQGEYKVYKAEVPDTTDSIVHSSKDIKNEFDSIALQLVNHARSIDYLNNKTKTPAKHKRRRYVPKHRRGSKNS